MIDIEFHEGVLSIKLRHLTVWNRLMPVSVVRYLMVATLGG